MTQQEAEVILKVNDQQARDKLAALENQAKDLRAQFADAFKRGDTRAINEITAKLQKTNKEINNMRTNAANIRAAMVRLNEASPRDLQRTIKRINDELNSGRVKRGTKEWDDYIAKLKQVKGELKKVKAEMDLDDKGSLFDRLKNGINDWGATAASAMAAFAGVVMSGKQAVQAYADMEGEMANVRKFTGMTVEEVEQLNEEFKKIDTRTSREDLNKLAQEAGRLGKTSQEDVLGFVRAADQINVALDDLGEGATLTLSKLTGIFGDEARYGTEQSLLKVGSVINELSQNCSASAPYLAEFASRLGGVGSQAGLSVQQIMGFAAVLDSNNQNLEASATALSQIIVRIYQDPAKYARIAGLDVENFAKLVKTDMNSALIELLGALNQVGGMDVLSPMFKDMGENGSRAISTLSNLANNIDAVRSQQSVANKAFTEGTSVTKEFDVQNSTVQAGLDKAKKGFTEMAVTLGKQLLPVMRYCISGTSLLMHVMSAIVGFIVKHKSALLTLTVAIVAYNVAVNAAIIKTKLLSTWHGIVKAATIAWTVATKACAVVVALCSGNITKATAAFKALSVAIKANPIGLLVSIIAAVGVGIANLISKTDEYADKIKKAVAQSTAYSKEMQKERLELDKLFGALEGARVGSEEYNKAKQKLMNNYGKYLEGLINEKGEIINLEQAYNRLANAIRIANQERGIQIAKENVENIYAEQMQGLTSALTSSLEFFGATAHDASRLTQSVVTSLSMGESVPQSTIDEINAYSANTPTGGEGASWWQRLDARTQNSLMADWGFIKQALQPAEIVNSMYRANTVKEEGLNEIDTTARLNRPLRDLEDHWLNYMIKYANSAVESGGGTVLKVVDALAGTFEQVEVGYEEAKSLLEQLQTEQAYRTGSAPKAGSGSGIDGDGDNNTPTPTPTLDSTDKFAAEKEWREREEALNRIAYATGQKDYVDYTNRMNEIAVKFFNRQLQHTDLSVNERLAIQAQYYEALNKQEQALSSQSIEEENTRYSDRLAELRQFYIDGQITQQTYEARVEEEELLHQHNLIALTEEGSRERAAAEQRYDDLRIQQIRRRQQETERLEQKYASMKSEFFGDNPDEKQAKLDADLAALQIVYEREIAAAGDNAAEKLRIDEAYERAKLALKKKYGLLAEEDTRNAMERGIADSIEWLNSDGGKAVTGTLDTLTSGMSAIFSQLSTMMQAELEMQTAAINKRYDAEIERAEGNSYKVKKLEKQKEAEIAKVKNEANRKMFNMQIIQAIAQTATNALAAFGSAAAVPVVGYILAPIAAAMAVAAGAVQIAAIKKQQQASQAQGYAEGGFTPKGRKYDAVGVVHAGEWVASQALVNNPRTRPLLEALDYAQKHNAIGSLRAADVSRTINAQALLSTHGADSPTIVNNTTNIQQPIENSERIVAVLDKLDSRLNEPFMTVNTVTGDHGILQAEEEYNRLMKNKSPKNKH